MKYKGDLPFVAYCDFENTAPTDCSLDPKIAEMFPLSCVITFASHPDLNIDRLTVEQSFGHGLSRLANVEYLNRDMLAFANSITMTQLQDCAKGVSQKKFKQAISEIFST